MHPPNLTFEFRDAPFRSQRFNMKVNLAAHCERLATSTGRRDRYRTPMSGSDGAAWGPLSLCMQLLPLNLYLNCLIVLTEALNIERQDSVTVIHPLRIQLSEFNWVPSHLLKLLIFLLIDTLLQPSYTQLLTPTRARLETPTPVKPSHPTCCDIRPPPARHPPAAFFDSFHGKDDSIRVTRISHIRKRDSGREWDEDPVVGGARTPPSWVGRGPPPSSTRPRMALFLYAGGCRIIRLLTPVNRLGAFPSQCSW